jgi:hypothetical protein
MNIRKIAKDYELKLIFITKNNIDKYLKSYNIERADLINNSYIIDDDVILGIYEDKEVRRAAFFHEVGHTLISESYLKMINYDIMLTEYQAWIEGLKISKRYKFKFSNNVFKYILTSINSYYKNALYVYSKQQDTENI